MQHVTTEELAARLAALPDNPRIVVSGNMSLPFEAVRLVDATLATFVLHALNGPKGLPDREGVTLETCFVGPGQRGRAGLRYIPSRLSLVPRLFAGPLPPDAVILHCAPPRDGLLSLGLEVNVLPAALEACRARGGLVVAVINPQMPRTGGDALVPVEHVDLAVEIDAPLATHVPTAPDADSQTIGARVGELIGDGATLQLGIGAVPDATLHAVLHRKGLRVWTEMFSDGVLALEEAGSLDRGHPLVTSFAFGSRDLYDLSLIHI